VERGKKTHGLKFLHTMSFIEGLVILLLFLSFLFSFPLLSQQDSGRRSKGESSKREEKKREGISLLIYVDIC
jgi:hypothetical protein